jgi:hypothetical protein
MVNKQQLFNTLWEEFDAQAKKKVAQRKLTGARTRDWNITDKSQKEEEQQQRQQLKKTQMQDSKMRRQHLKQQEKKVSDEAKMNNRT